MKQSIRICFSFLLTLAVFAASCVSAGAAETPSLVGAQIKSAPGGMEDFTVALDGETELACFLIEVRADPTVFSLSSLDAVEQGDFSDKGTLLCNTTADRKGWRVAWYSTENVICNGTLFHLPLRVNTNAAAGTYPVEISYSKSNTQDASGASPQLSCINGSIEVSNVPAEQAVMRIADVTPVGAGDYADVSVELLQNPGLAAFQLTLECDQLAFSLDPMEDSNDGFQIFPCEDVLPGTPLCTAYGNTGWQVYWYNASNTTKTGRLFTIRIHVSENTPIGSYPIHLGVIGKNTVNQSGQPVAVQAMDGAIQVRDVTLEECTAQYDQATGQLEAELMPKYLSATKKTTVFATCYSADGKMLRTEMKELFSGETASISWQLPPNSEVRRFTVIALDKVSGSYQPICPAKEITLIS